jgi:hypothetical protein
MTETMSLSLIDSHCHIDRPQNARTPHMTGPFSMVAGGFDAGLIFSSRQAPPGAPAKQRCSTPRPR